MKKNMGLIDRVIRLFAAVIIAVLIYLDVISGTLGIILLIIAGIFILTSFMSVCPLYIPFRINTRRSEK